jgi:hypothetical protein
MFNESIGHLIDVVNVVILGRQRQGLTEGICVDSGIVVLKEVRLEITYTASAALVFEDRP